MKKLITVFIALIGIISISTAQVVDLKSEAIVEPNNGCDLKINELVKLRVKNVSTGTTINKYSLCYSIDGGPASCDTIFSVSIIPTATYTHTFTTAADLSTIKAYNIKAWCEVLMPNVSDNNQSNDTTTKIVENQVLTFPLYEPLTSFNLNAVGTFPQGYRGVPSTTNDFAWSIKSAGTALTGPSVDHTGSPALSRFLAVDNSKGSVNNFAYFTSPCIDLQGVNIPVLEYWYHMYGADMGNLYIEAKGSIFNTWVLIDSVIGKQQTSKNQAWRKKSVGLAQFAGQFVNFRLRANKTSAGPNGMIAVDDIRIIFPDSGQGQVVGPVGLQDGRCNYSSCETVRVRIKNVGRDTLKNFVATYQVDSLPIVSQNFSINIAPFKTQIVTFTQCADLSVYKTYNIKYTLDIPTDTDSTDNIFNQTITNIVPIPIAMFENFESFSTGNNNSGNHANDWKATVGTYKWTIKTGGTPSSGTGPSADHTKGNAAGKYFFTEADNGFPGEVATLTSTCLDFTNIVAPYMKYWYHRFGFDMGDMYVDINKDDKWFTVDSLKGEQQTNSSDAWKQRTIDLDTAKVAGKSARIRFRALRGNGFAGDMGLDDLFLYDLTDYDVGPVDMTKPDTNQYTCYTANQEIRVRIQNFGALPLDFSTDSVEITVFVTKNGLPWDTAYTRVTTNAYNPTVNQPLKSDKTALIPFTGIDMSSIGDDYGFTIVTNMMSGNDTVPFTDTLRPDNIVTRKTAGTVFASATTVCQGTAVTLSDTTFFGQIKWQRQSGSNWIDEFGPNSDFETYVTFPVQAVNVYRAKVCNDTYSAPITVNVTIVPAPTVYGDTSCGPGMLNLKSDIPPSANNNFWYSDINSTGPVFFGANYSRNLTTTTSFWVSARKDSCYSPRVKVVGTVSSNPKIPFNALDTVICPDTSYYLNAGAHLGLGTNYIWSSNDTSVAGKTLQTIGVDPFILNLKTRYWYSVYVKSSFECETYSDTAWITFDDSACGVGFKDYSALGEVRLYPNPNNGQFTIEIKTDQPNNADIQILSMQGRLVYEEKGINTLGFNKTIDIRNLTKGVYYLKLATDQGVLVEKIVLQ